MNRPEYLILAAGSLAVAADAVLRTHDSELSRFGFGGLFLLMTVFWVVRSFRGRGL